LLVTGGSGFVGQALRQYAAECGAGASWRLEFLPPDLDIRSPGFAEALPHPGPSAVLHLAAISNVDESFRDPELCFDINFNGTWNLLRALRKSGFSGRLLYVSSGDCYGTLPDEALPVGEDRPLRPRNPYAVSKTAAEALCYQWSQTEGADVVIARPFNHIGPGQDQRFAIASFCRQIANIEAGKAPATLRTGNLDVTRDFADVRDVLRAYYALLERGRTGEAYNVASGREVRLGDALDALLAMSGVDAKLEVDDRRKRSSEQRRVVADIVKIKRDVGWEPRIGLRESLEGTLDYWRKRVRDE
jgi:GDP-4-dehydro-6-deoxy-D-mannose reductase